MSIYAKFTYVVLFIALLLEPHVVKGHLFLVDSPFVDNAVTIAVFLIGVLVYAVHKRDLKRKTRENQRLATQLQEGQKKLLDSFKYIGLMNRQLPLLKNLTSDILVGFRDVERDRRRIFDQLLHAAVISILDADWGTLRFIDRSRCRTLKEFSLSRSGLSTDIRIGNKELLNGENKEGQRKGMDVHSFIMSSNVSHPEMCFLVIPKMENLPEDKRDILQAIVDQAHLFYRYAYAHRHA